MREGDGCTGDDVELIGREHERFSVADITRLYAF